MNIGVPPRPDVVGETAPPRPRLVLTYGLLAAIGWLAGSYVAWRSLGWYPLPTAKTFFLVGWPPLLVMGLLLNRLEDLTARRSLAAALTLVAFVLPPVAAGTVAGVKQPPEYAIPGRPWRAVTAAPAGLRPRGTLRYSSC